MGFADVSASSPMGKELAKKIGKRFTITEQFNGSSHTWEGRLVDFVERANAEVTLLFDVGGSPTPSESHRIVSMEEVT